MTILCSWSKSCNERGGTVNNRICATSDVNIRMSMRIITKIVSPKAGHLASVQGSFLLDNSRNLELLICNDHDSPLADVSLKFGV